MSCSLNKFYTYTGTSKQAFHARLDRHFQKKEELYQLELIVHQVRRDHPKMALRDLYWLIQPKTMGRDRFEQSFAALGYGVGRKRSFKRTTDSSGVIRFPNLIDGKKLTGVNQVWVSDITYYELDKKFYYMTFIMDLYSRKILGYQVSKSLRTDHTTLPALNMALKTREDQLVPGLIFHSDGGGQYYSDSFLKVTKEHNIKNSMGTTAIENPHAERLNGIIKNNYVYPYNPKSFQQLVRMTTKAVKMYNQQKPHRALQKRSPDQFEMDINKKDGFQQKKKRSKKRKATTTRTTTISNLVTI